MGKTWVHAGHRSPMCCQTQRRVHQPVKSEWRAPVGSECLLHPPEASGSFACALSQHAPRGSAAALLRCHRGCFTARVRGLPPTFCLLSDVGWDPSQPADKPGLVSDQQDVMWHMPGVACNGGIILLAPLSLNGWITRESEKDPDTWDGSEQKPW